MGGEFEKEAIMTVQGIPADGLKTVGKIVPTNEVKFRENLSGMEVAVELLSQHTPGGAVVDRAVEVVVSVTTLCSATWKAVARQDLRRYVSGGGP